MTVRPPPATALAISLLGPFSVSVNGAPLPRLHSHKEEAILALLTLRHDRPVERAWLAGLLWPDTAESQGLATLRRYLAYLRRALGSEVSRLQSPTSSSLVLDLTGATVDLITFDTALARGERQSLEAAVALYQGPLLEGWTEEWVFEERSRREQAYLQALEALATDALQRGDLRTAEQHLRRVAAVDPLRETAQRALMQTLAAGGSYAAAIQSYRDLRLLLHRELNAGPAPETEALFQQLRTEAQSKAALGSRLSALGKGGRSSRAEWLADVFAESREPRAERRSEATRHNLSASLSRFIGREREMTEVKERLRSTRLLTLTGVGGCGKTRLALEVCAQVLAEYTHGVWLVELAALSHPALLPQTVAAVLRVREQPGRSIMEILTDRLRERQALLVLDNCEHLVAACASLAHTLLRSCPHLGILATSRQPLGIAGEAVWPVPPLSLPPPGGHPEGEDLTQYESVCLFVDRATQALPDFRLTPREASAVAQVCRRLDGLPLALELAAARVRALSVEQISQRLEDRFHLLTGGSRTALPRHQTLRSLIDWSYDLLSEAEKRLFRRLSSFVGGFTLEAVEAVCVDPAVRDDPVGFSLAHLALEGVASLVDQSMVRREDRARLYRCTQCNEPTPSRDDHRLRLAMTSGAPPPAVAAFTPSATGPAAAFAEARYGMLETIRAYGRELLEVSGEAGLIRRRHAEFFLALAERAETALSGPNQAEWLDRLEFERDNLGSAIEWSIESGEHAIGLRLGTALWQFWLARCHPAEGREHLTRLLALPGAEEPTALRARALSVAAVSTAAQGEATTARALIEESVTISRALDDADCLVEVLITMGNIALSEGEVALARACCEESLARGRVLDNQRVIAWSLFFLGYVAHREEADEAAWALYEESRTTWEALGDMRGVALALSHLGQMATRRGEYGTAQRLHGESLALRRTLGDRSGIVSSLNHLGDVALWSGDTVAARKRYEESLAMSRELGDRVIVAWLLNSLGRLAGDEGDPEAASRFLAEGLLLWREMGDQRWGMAECLEELGWMAAQRGQPERAAEMFGTAEALRGEGAPPRVPPDRTRYEGRVAALGAALGEEAFAAAWAEGRAMMLEQAVAYAFETGGFSATGGE